MKNNYIRVMLCVTLFSCESGSKSTQAAQQADAQPNIQSQATTGGAITYKINTINKKIPDDASPIGNWEINKTYPVIQAAQMQELTQTLNKKITALVNQYVCKNKGDETFNGEVTLANDKLFSMRYESMWMCATMLAPVSVRGALNIDIRNNAVIYLENEFVSDAARMAFVESALKRMNQEISVRSKQNQMKCAPAISLGRFYITQDALVISTPTTAHSDSACEVEVSLSRMDIRSQLGSNSALQP